MKIRTFKEPQEYGQTLAKMEALVEDIIAGNAEEQIWFLEHENVYTAGTSADERDLVDAKFPVFNVGRGGKYTYHGPGQRVIYLMLDLKKHYRPPDLRKFVFDLEQWVINSLAEIGIEAFRREGRIGIWVSQKPEARNQKAEINIKSKINMLSRFAQQHRDLDPDAANTGRDDISENKIAAVGIRVRKWVSFHGISININPALENFDGIVPCGISEFGVTSLEKLLDQRHCMEKIDPTKLSNCHPALVAGAGLPRSEESSLAMTNKTLMEEFDKILMRNLPFK